jgi:hypothetical protein
MVRITMRQMKSVALLLLLGGVALAADTQWILEQCTLTYHVSHPLHQTDGVSQAARGKGICHEGQCDFLIAVPVKSFDSGDSNRDIHMVQVTRGAEFPMVSVRTRLPESAATSASIHADLEIQFAGQTAHYKDVPFQLTAQGNQIRVSGTIPATLADFKIDPPTLLSITCEERNPSSRRNELAPAVSQDCRQTLRSPRAIVAWWTQWVAQKRTPPCLPRRAGTDQDGALSVSLSRFFQLGAHLFHELAHGRDMAGRAVFGPFLIALRGLFQVGAERLGNETLSECWYNRLDPLPDTEKLSAGFEEQVLVQQTIVEQSTGLLPVIDDHIGERGCFRTHWSNPHSVVKACHMIVLKKPVTRLAQPGLAALIVNLKM